MYCTVLTVVNLITSATEVMFSSAIVYLLAKLHKNNSADFCKV